MDFARAAVTAVHKHNKAGSRVAPAVVVCTGGGNMMSSLLLNISGASASILAAAQPYSRAAAAQLASRAAAGDMSSAVSHSSAVTLAQGAFHQATELSLIEACAVNPQSAHWAAGNSLLPLPQCVGVACTASLAAHGKKGPHRAFIASVTATETRVLAANLPADTREAEDCAVSSLALAALAQACGVPTPTPTGTAAGGASESNTTSSTWLQIACAHLGLQEHTCAASGEGQDVPLPPTAGAVAHARWAHTPALTRLLRPKEPNASPVRSVLCTPPAITGGVAACVPQPVLPPGTLLLPGSFNPLHSGHEELAAAALRFLEGMSTGAADGVPLPHPPTGLVVFELSATNADKPPLQDAVLGARLAQFVGSSLPAAVVGEEVARGAAQGPPSDWPTGGVSYRSALPSAVVVTDAPLFVQKGPLFPGCIFVLGVDTVVRLVDAKYYGGDEGTMLVQLGSLLHLRCRVLVAGRVVDKGPAAGRYLGLEDVLEDIPAALRPLFIALPADAFRADVSSSELRTRAAEAAAAAAGDAAAQ